MPPVAQLEESVSNIVFLVGLNCSKIEAEVNIFFISLKAILVVSVHLKGLSFFVRFVSGVAILE